MRDVRPPRLARALLERTLPADVRDDVLGDLEEVFRRDHTAHGAFAARRRYWTKALSFSRSFAGERLRERRLARGAVFSRADFVLALRMLVRYPGLTLIGVLGMAVGITIAAGAFSILYTFGDPSLPLPDGDRIITIQTRDQARSRVERRVAADFHDWRQQVPSLEGLGVFRQVARNLIVPGAQPEATRVAEISPSAFRVTGVSPLLGRHLVESDDRPGAAPVLVLGHDLWRLRFASDPTVVGRTVQLGDTTHEIVGVMPEGYAFPVNDGLWVPVRLDRHPAAPGRGMELTVFGRLAPGATFESAQAEIDVLAARAAATFPDTHARRQVRVLPYTFPFFDIEDPNARWMLHLLQFLITLLLVVVCINVAILVYARTATRRAEIAVRTALGASRGRIVAQLFVEALVLAGAATVVGVATTSFGLRQLNLAMKQVFSGLPFWWRFELSPGVLLYIAALTLLAAVIVGVVPALRATGRRVQAGLKSLSAGGGSSMQLGRTWTGLIVVQVAFAVALLPAAVFNAWDSWRYATADLGFPAAEFLAAQLTLDRAPGPATPDASRAMDARFAARQRELVERLGAEPGVAAVALSSTIPGGESTAWMEAEGIAPPGGPVEAGWVRSGTRAGHEARFNRVAPGFFEVFDIPLRAGRRLSAADAAPAVNTVVVNESFVRDVLGGRDGLGRRVRYVGISNDAAADEVELGPWHEIAGVVADFPSRATESGLSAAKVYHAVPADRLYGGVMSIQVRGRDAAGFSGRLREIAAAVDPALQLRNVNTLDALLRNEQGILQLTATVLGVLTISVLLLSSAGIYALMSFTVAQRRKEIGIRSALGADPRRILRSIFSRAAWQLAAGVAAGAALAAGLDVASDGELMKGHGPVVLPAVATFMILVGLLAAFGPARRGLRIHPTEALREE